MKQKISFIFLCCMLSKLTSFAQNPALKIDSLISVLKTQKEDTSKVNTLNTLAFLNRNSNPDTAFYFATEALALAEHLHFKTGIAESHLNNSSLLRSFGEFEEALINDSIALNICNELLSAEQTEYNTRILQLKKRAFTGLGNYSFFKSNYPEALQRYTEGLRISEAIGDKRGIASMYGNIANSYGELGNYPEAVKMHFACLKIFEELGSKRDIANCYNNVGRMYDAQHNYPEALKMYSASLKLGEEIDDPFTMTLAYNNIGGIYLADGNYDAALQSLHASLKISEKNQDDRNTGNSYSNIGNVYMEQQEYTAALKNYFLGLEIQERMEDPTGIAATSISVGKVYTQLGKYDDAFRYLEKGLSLSKESRHMENIKNAYEGLSLLDSARGNFKQSLSYYKNFVSYRDSLFNADITRKTVQSQMQYEFDKKETATKAEQEKKNALTTAEISKQKIIRNFSITGGIGVLLLGGYLFYNFRKRKKMENLHALSNERLRISRELHDDIGSTLGSIAVFSDVAKNRSMKNGNPAEILTKIGFASRDLIEKMSDIVWSLNPSNETFEQLQSRMQAFAAMILTPQDIFFEFKNEGDVKNLTLTNEQRKNLFLIYKEAIHNVVKYADCKNVSVRFTKSGNKLICSIRDDGKGFDVVSFEEGKEVAYNGNGLKNMKARADEIKASLIFTSASNEGTTISLDINTN